MYKMGVIGDADTVLAFKAMGISTFSVNSPDMTRKVLNRIVNDYGVIFITERTAQEVLDIIDKYNNKAIPMIILIPDNKGSMNIGMNRLKRSVEAAIGIDIFKNEGDGIEGR